MGEIDKTYLYMADILLRKIEYLFYIFTLSITIKIKQHKKGKREVMKRLAFILVGFSSLTWSGFTTQGGIIKDNETKLEWQNSFRGDIKELDWDSAIAYCRNFKLNGEGWRLPTKEELVSIMDRGEDANTIRTKDSKPAIKNIFLNRKIEDINYWTSTFDKDDSNLKWGVNFKRGWAGIYSKHFILKVRCVRGELQDNIPMAKLLGVVGKESKPFSEGKGGNLVILGEPNPIMVKK